MTMTPLELHVLFNANQTRHQKFKVMLRGGVTVEGVPYAGSMFHPNAEFTLHVNGVRRRFRLDDAIYAEAA